MTDQKSKSEKVNSWALLRDQLVAAYRPRTAESIGKRCATDYCDVTIGISYEKPLCLKHWQEFQNFYLEECDRCHWFGHVLLGEIFTIDDGKKFACLQCLQREGDKNQSVVIHAHRPVERITRYLYILKLNGKPNWYVGQTNSLEMRLHEHMDGLTKTTQGKDPKLVWFKRWAGSYEELLEAESNLTYFLHQNPRGFRRMVEEWQKPYRLVDWNS